MQTDAVMLQTATKLAPRIYQNSITKAGKRKINICVCMHVCFKTCNFF